LFELVFAKPRITVATVYERVAKRVFVPGIFPHKPILDNRRIEPLYIVPLINEPVPPTPFDIVREFHAERAVVPRGAQAAIDVGGRINKSATLRKRDYCFDIRC